MTAPLINFDFVEVRARDGASRMVSSLKINKGEKVALVGSDEEFRKALLRNMAGIEAPAKGQLFVDGHPVAIREERDLWGDLLPPKIRRKMGVSFLNDSLLSNISVGENFETLFRFKYGDHNQGLIEGARKVPRQIAAQLGLSEQFLDLRPAQLSDLDLRLAALCLAFLTKPSVLMLDNPSHALSEDSWTQLDATIKRMISGTQKTFVLSTSDWILADSLCDRWIVLEDKKIVFDGSKEAYSKAFHLRMKEQLETPKLKRLRQIIRTVEEEVA